MEICQYWEASFCTKHTPCNLKSQVSEDWNLETGEVITYAYTKVDSGSCLIFHLQALFHPFAYTPLLLLWTLLNDSESTGAGPTESESAVWRKLCHP